jgi:hypothetical protein
VQYTVRYITLHIKCVSFTVDQPSLTDLCCFWSATNALPVRGETFQVRFDDGSSDLPFAETCFAVMTLPTKHQSYQEFQTFMNIALTYGSLGIQFV